MDWQTFEHAQMMYRVGVSLLTLLLKDTDCEPQAGYMQFDRNFQLITETLPTPTGKRSALSLAINAPEYNHALGVIFDNEAKTFTFLDSSFEETHENPRRVISVLKSSYPGYRYISASCPQGILPQKSDSLCTMWSYFLISRSCGGGDVSEYLRETPRPQVQDEFMAFIDMLYERFEASDLYTLYREYQKTYVNLLLSYQLLLAHMLRRDFRDTQDQGALIESMQQHITRKTDLDHTYDSASFLRNIVHVLQKIPVEHQKGVLEIFMRTSSIMHIANELYTYHKYGKYILLEVFHDEDMIYIMSPEMQQAYQEFYMPYKLSIRAELQQNNVDPKSRYPIADYLTKTKQWEVPMNEVFYRSHRRFDRKSILGEILADNAMLHNYLSYAFAGRNMNLYLYGTNVAIGYLPPLSRVTPIRMRSRPELVFLYYVYVHNQGKRIIDPNVDDLMDIRADPQVISDALADTFDTLGVDPGNPSEIPESLQPLMDRYYMGPEMPRKKRVNTFLRLVNFDTGRGDTLEASQIKVMPEFQEEGKNYEYRIQYTDEPIEEIAEDYLESREKFYPEGEEETFYYDDYDDYR